MKLLSTFLLAPALFLAMPASLQAAPANVAAAVAAKSRPADAVALDASRRPVEILRFFGLERGDRALDLIAGSGYYTEIMARAVGRSGSVLAWQPVNFYDDEAKKSWTALRDRVPNAGLFASTAAEFALAPESIDFAMLHLIYHDTYWESTQYGFPRMDPAAFLAKLHAGMKPGGVVAVIDHVAQPGGDVREVADKLHRIDPAVIRRDFEQAGFVFDGESDLLRNSADDHSKLVFDPGVRGKTDRVAYRFKKPG
jgi:predicted methyltransferase